MVRSVVTDVVCVRIAVEDGLRGAAVERLVGDVAAADDQTARFVKGEATDAAAMLEDGAHLPGVVDSVNATTEHIAEEQTMLRTVDRAFYQTVAVRDPFHLNSPSSGDRPQLARTESSAPSIVLAPPHLKQPPFVGHAL